MNKGEIKTFPGKQKQKEYITVTTALQEMLRVLQTEMKECQAVKTREAKMKDTRSSMKKQRTLVKITTQ